MAAGLGYKDFTVGEVLSAANVNGYLMQGVLVFANAAARTAAITSPQEGQMSFLKDTNSTEYYDGAAWQTVSNPGDITAVTVTSPITGGGTSGSVGIAIQDASTSQRGSVQLSDSTSTTSSILAATPTAVKSAYDLAIRPASPSPYVAGRYYTSPISPIKTLASTSAVNTTYYAPIYIRENVTADRILTVTGSTFSGTNSVRLGIYNNSNFTPTTVLLDAGTVATSVSTTAYEITISQALTPGWYWLAANTVTAATTNTFQSWSSQTGTTIYDMGTTTPTSSQSLGFTQSVNATSGFATATGLSYSNQIQYISLRA
jgi:hypothetical protein